jgi:Histidine kinase-, DNA gyrase B-, and HSP90-like ATPase
MQEGELAKIIPLRYVARAGLLPELTRQTYDSLYKALREAILNSIDAGATSVTVDLAAVEPDRMLEITDDGSGMSLSDLQQSFMSLGGSRKFGAADMFGRIGIGSLALMHYAEAVHIETKEAGSSVVTKAIVSHPWSLAQEQRALDLADLAAGEAWQETSRRPKRDHYTTIRLIGVDDVLVRECADVAAHYQLVEQLRRILPLTWPATKLDKQLRKEAPDLVALIEEHTSYCCANVTVRSQWSSDDVLTKRVFGDGGIPREPGSARNRLGRLNCAGTERSRRRAHLL